VAASTRRARGLEENTWPTVKILKPKTRRTLQKRLRLAKDFPNA
jgi:hypothetical protein